MPLEGLRTKMASPQNCNVVFEQTFLWHDIPRKCLKYRETNFCTKSFICIFHFGRRSNFEQVGYVLAVFPNVYRSCCVYHFLGITNCDMLNNCLLFPLLISILSSRIIFCFASDMIAVHTVLDKPFDKKVLSNG